MAIDMTTVKQIMHGNKEVTKIEDSLGNILWQKQVTPTLIYNVNMFTIRCTVRNKRGYFDVNMFNGNQGTVVDSATSTDQYFCLLKQSDFDGFNNKTLASGTTIGNTFNYNPGNSYRLCYYDQTSSTMHLVGGSTTITNDTPIGNSNSWANTGQFYAAVAGTNTATNSEMFRVTYNNTVNLRINAYKKPVYHTNTDATGFTIGNRQSVPFTR